MARYLYVASQDRNGEILCCQLSAAGELTVLHRTPADRVAYLCEENGILHALLREPFQMQSGVASYRIESNGSLTPIGKIQPVHGTISAHILSHHGSVYTANYLSGTTTRMPDKLLAHNGSSIDTIRQTCSHPHCITATPDGSYLSITDLGTDCIYICTLDLVEVSRVHLPAGSGPRHLIFSPDKHYAYCSNEIGSSVSSFSWESGKLTLRNTVRILPQTYDGPSSSSAIRISKNGKQLYVSLRQYDKVCFLEVAGPHLIPRQWIPCGGISPREILLEDPWLLCANEDSHNIQVISIADPNSPRFVSSFPVLRPWCILPVER